MTTSEPQPEAKDKQKALCVATRCATVDQFIATFHRFCDETSFFVATLTTRPIGLETAFSVQLEDRTPVLRGLCVVIEAWSTPANRFGRPGVRLGVRRLTNESIEVFQRLQTARTTAEASAAPGTPAPVTIPPARGAESGRIVGAALPSVPRSKPNAIPPIPKLVTGGGLSATIVSRPGPTPSIIVDGEIVDAAPVLAGGTQPPPQPRAEGTPPPTPPLGEPVAAPVPPPLPASARAESPPAIPEAIAVADDLTNPIATESRIPGSSLVLPANPLMNLTDQSLQGFVDCALYEETGNFFRAPGYEDSLVDIDDIAPPPLAPVAAIRVDPGGDQAPLSPLAFVPAPPQHFAPEATPLPMLISIPEARSAYPTSPPYQAAYAPVHPATPPHDSTAALLRLAAPERRRWQLIAGAAVTVSVVLLIVVLATRGNDRADASVPPPTTPTPSTATARVPATPPDRATAPDATKAAPATGAAPDTATGAAPDATETATETATEPAIEVAALDGTAEHDAAPVVGEGPCRMVVATTPAGSIVRVDDRTMGPSPITIAGPCARRRVDVRHPRYAPGTRWVNLTEGTPANVDISLTRPTHALTVVTQPTGATISIAGRRAGTTPSVVKIMGFTRVTVTIEKRGYKPVVHRLYSKVAADKLSVRLQRGR